MERPASHVKSTAEDFNADSLEPEQRTYMRRVGLPEPNKGDAVKMYGVTTSPEIGPTHLSKPSARHSKMTFGTFDRGAGVYHDERQRHKSASLVETGR